MSAHIRKEERQLFERLQELMTQEELAVLGQDLEQALKDAEQSLHPTLGSNAVAAVEISQRN